VLENARCTKRVHTRRTFITIDRVKHCFEIIDL